ncbi:MAG: hypothetical protein H7Y13_09995 [Sphingobacteriaceae bacterium]|nr:hypothetical protein [Sphingobacteriaceae bacterium]
MTLQRFLVLYFTFLVVLAAAPLYIALYYPEKDLLIPHFWVLFAAFAILTFQIYMVASRRMRMNDKASGQALLGSVTVKFLFGMILAFVYLYNIDTDKTNFILNFFYLYLFHTVFEIYSLLCNLRNQK